MKRLFDHVELQRTLAAVGHGVDQRLKPLTAEWKVPQVRAGFDHGGSAAVREDLREALCLE